MALSLTEQLGILGTEALTARIEALTPSLNAYATIVRVRAKVRQSKRNLNQLLVIPFPHLDQEEQTEALMLLNVVGSDTIFRALNKKSAQSGPKIDPGTVHSATVTLAPSLDSLVRNVAWNEISVAGDYERRMQSLRKDYGTGYGFAVVAPEYDLGTGLTTFTVGWIWYGPTATVPSGGPGGRVWVLNEQVDSLRSVAPSRVVDATEHDPKTHDVRRYLKVCTMHKEQDTEAVKNLEIKGSVCFVFSANVDVPGIFVAERKMRIAPKPTPLPPASQQATPAPRHSRTLWIGGTVFIVGIVVCIVICISRFASTTTEPPENHRGTTKPGSVSQP